MKKINRYLILTAIVLVCAVANVILFLTVPDGRTDTGVFWLVWTFMTPVALLAACALHLWGTRKSAGDLVSMTVVYYLSIIFTLAYLTAGLIFAYLPWKKMVLPLIVELVITAAYILAAMYFLRGAEYIRAEETHTRGKVLYIRFLKADVDDCIAKAQSEELKAALVQLSDNMRFSDPMSHPSLAAIEGELTATVAEISEKIDREEESEAMALVDKAQKALEKRNSRCLMLK
ncbi:MAG: hypothetical protein IJY21_01185 [Clostridia bacterium]|nr:hypothetical protein [Clostridia bacterium]